MDKRYSDFFVDFSRLYLAAGGPTSRLEAIVERLSYSWKIVTNIYATPTGVFLTVRANNESFTEICRIKKQNNNFEEIYRLENLAGDLEKAVKTIDDAIVELRNQTADELNRWLKIFSFFVLGVASSYMLRGDVLKSLVAGLITTGTLGLISHASARLRFNTAMSDFLAIFIGLVFAGISAVLFDDSVHLFAMGVVLYIVPGLSLTNAVSELASQNLVSGSAKLMKSLLSLFAMGTAGYLFVEIYELVFEMPVLELEISAISFAEKIICHILLLIAFCLLFRVPRKAFFWAVLCGVLSWGVFRLLEGHPWVVFRSFFPSLIVGLISLFVGRLFKLPSQFISVPGILSLVPGMLALSLIQNSFTTSSGEGSVLRVVLTTSSIVFGLLTARIPFNLASVDNYYLDEE